ncbi:unnamed protein product [Caretta caretta]
MAGDDFSALPCQLQVGDVDSCLHLYEGVMRFFFLHHNLIGRYYSEWQHLGERPEHYFNRKKRLFWLVGALSWDTPEFVEVALQGLNLTLRIALEMVDPQITSLKDLEAHVCIAHELQREAFPSASKKRVSVVTESGKWQNTRQHPSSNQNSPPVDPKARYLPKAHTHQKSSPSTQDVRISKQQLG